MIDYDLYFITNIRYFLSFIDEYPLRITDNTLHLDTIIEFEASTISWIIT